MKKVNKFYHYGTVTLNIDCVIHDRLILYPQEERDTIEKIILRDMWLLKDGFHDNNQFNDAIMEKRIYFTNREPITLKYNHPYNRSSEMVRVFTKMQLFKSYDGNITRLYNYQSPVLTVDDLTYQCFVVMY